MLDSIINKTKKKFFFLIWGLISCSVLVVFSENFIDKLQEEAPQRVFKNELDYKYKPQGTWKSDKLGMKEKIEDLEDYAV